MSRILQSILFILIAGSSLTLGAEVLCWMVEENPQTVKFAYAQVVAADESGNRQELEIYDMSAGRKIDDVTSMDVDATGYATDKAWVSLDYAPAANQWAGYSFFVELLDENDVPIGSWRSESMGYGELANHIWGSSTEQLPEALVFKGVSSVPEPTGGMLMLLGVAMLALRRRKPDFDLTEVR